MSEINREIIISTRWVILTDIDGESIRGDSLRAYQGIISPQQQGSTLVKNIDKDTFEEARAHSEFLDISLEGGNRRW